MIISQIYKKYKIMPMLQEHLYRVTAVAKLICDNWNGKIDKKEIIYACLLHDMGNIIKFNLGYIPEAVQPKGLAYWQKIKDEYIHKYGNDEHIATLKIAKEIGIKDKIIELIKAVGFSKSVINYKHSNFAKKICAYSDHRVTPFGITSLEKRMHEGRKRFKINTKDRGRKDQFNLYASYLRKIERQIFNKCQIKPEDINDRSVNPIVENLKDFEIVTNVI